MHAPTQERGTKLRDSLAAFTDQAMCHIEPDDIFTKSQLNLPDIKKT